MTLLMSPRTELSLWLRAGPRALSLRAQTEGRSFPLLQRQLFHPLQHSLHLPLSQSQSLCAQPAAISGTVPCQANSSCSGSISALFGKSRPQRPSPHSTNEPVPSLCFCTVVPCTEHHWLCLCCPALPETIHHLLLPSHSTSNTTSAKNAPSAP